MVLRVADEYELSIGVEGWYQARVHYFLSRGREAPESVK